MKAMTAETISPVEAPPNCPDCGTKMGKAGKVWSGHNRRQMWKCSNCGRSTILNPNGNGSQTNLTKRSNEPSVKPPQDNHHRLCDGSYTFKDTPYHCKTSENGYCTRTTFPVSCPKYDLTEWEALSTK